MSFFLFEFMDQSWIPASLHATLREVLEYHHEVSIYYYYSWATTEILKKTQRLGISKIIEMGAGSAGLSQALAKLIREKNLKLQIEVCDLRPDLDRYRALEKRFPGILYANPTSVDLRFWVPPKEPILLLMSSTFHHIPPSLRTQVLRSLRKSPAMIFESVSKCSEAIRGCALGFLSGMLTPLYFFKIPQGRWRRFIWCWFFPIAPFMVAFDGVVSCFRCWTEGEWRAALTQVGLPDSYISIQRHRVSDLISW